MNAVSAVKYTAPCGSLETRMGTAGTTADLQYRVSSMEKCFFAVCGGLCVFKAFVFNFLII